MAYIISALVMTAILLIIVMIFDEILISYALPSMVVNLIYWTILIIVRLLILVLKKGQK